MSEEEFITRLVLFLIEIIVSVFCLLVSKRLLKRRESNNKTRKLSAEDRQKLNDWWNERSEV